MLKVSLRRCFGALLKFKKIILNLFRVQLGGQGFKMQRQGRHVTGIIIKGSGAFSLDGNIPLKALQEFGKTVNFATGAIQKFVRS